MNRYLAFFSIITVGIVAAFGISTFTDLPGPLSLLGETNCQWQDVQINGQTYSTLEIFKEEWNANSDTNFTELESQFDFRIQDETLQYRTCSQRGVSN